MALTSKQIRYLRSLAHALSPSAQLGKSGFTPALIKEIDRNLADHELVKIRLGTDDRDEFLHLAASVASETTSSLVQAIGRIAVFYRPSKKPKIVFPGMEDADAKAKRKASESSPKDRKIAASKARTPLRGARAAKSPARPQGGFGKKSRRY